MTLEDMVRLTAAFRSENEWAQLWAVYPAVDEQTDEAMPACEGMSEAFATYLREHGVEAHVVEADAADADADYHRWVRVEVAGVPFNVDWTARQYHNLVWPPAPELQDLPCPMAWPGGGPEHPLVRFTRQRIVAI